jgi:hypothetical protein
MQLRIAFAAQLAIPQRRGKLIGANGTNVHEYYKPESQVHLGAASPNFPSYFLLNGVRANWGAGPVFPSVRILTSQGPNDSHIRTNVAARDRKRLYHRLRKENPRGRHQINGSQTRNALTSFTSISVWLSRYYPAAHTKARETDNRTDAWHQRSVWNEPCRRYVRTKPYMISQPKH